MAFTPTATKTIRMGGGVRLHLGTFTNDSAGDSGDIVVTGYNVISVNFQRAGDSTDWELAPVQVTYSASSSTGRTTFTVKCLEAVTTGSYAIMVL